MWLRSGKNQFDSFDSAVSERLPSWIRHDRSDGNNDRHPGCHGEDLLGWQSASHGKFCAVRFSYGYDHIAVRCRHTYRSIYLLPEGYKHGDRPCECDGSRRALENVEGERIAHGPLSAVGLPDKYEPAFSDGTPADRFVDSLKRYARKTTPPKTTHGCASI